MRSTCFELYGVVWNAVIIVPCPKEWLMGFFVLLSSFVHEKRAKLQLEI